MTDRKEMPLFRERKREELQKRWQDIDEKRSGHTEALVEEFKRECELVSGKVYVAQTEEEACRFLSSIIKEAGIRTAIKWDLPLFKRLGIDHLLDSLGVQNMLPAEKDPASKVGQRDYAGPAGDAELGISGADYGLADTGTLVLRALPGQERSTSVLPPVHVAIMESERILPGLDDLISRLVLDFDENGRLDSCLTLITGPSKTADIESNLVLGMHGPKDLHVIILEGT